MTARLPRICSYPTCPNTTTTGTYCEEHAKAVRRQRWRLTDADKDPATRRFYASARWQRTRRQILSDEPVCQACDARPSRAVDHIIPMSEGGARWERSNLQALCKVCHDKKTGREVTARRRSNETNG